MKLQIAIPDIAQVQVEIGERYGEVEVIVRPDDEKFFPPRTDLSWSKAKKDDATVMLDGTVRFIA